MPTDRPWDAETPWPPSKPGGAWPQSYEKTTPSGADFPGSSGDRERGKFRPSHTPRLTQVAVVDDDGNPVGYVLAPDMADMALQLQAIRRGIELLLELLAPADQLTSIDLLSEVANALPGDI